MNSWNKRIVVVSVTLGAVTAGAVGVAAAMPGGGPAGFFFHRGYERAAKELQLTPEQKQKTDALRARMKATWQQRKQSGDHQAFRAEGRALWLADTFDDAKADALHAKMQARQAERHQAMRASMKELHGILTAAQRQKLVDIAERFHQKLRGRWGKHRGPRAAE